jgi:hypothetical protein
MWPPEEKISVSAHWSRLLSEPSSDIVAFEVRAASNASLSPAFIA